MRIVVALGGNALLQTRRADDRGESSARNVRIAAEALAPIATEHQLVISHGNGPQVGLLALQGAAYKPDEAYPLDVLGAETEGMIGYMIEQELGNLLPFEVPFATLLTMVEVDPRRSRPSRTRPSSSAPSTTSRTPTGSRRRRAGRSSRTATSGAASCRRRCPSGSSRCARSNGCWSRDTIVICRRRRRHPDDVRAGQADRKLVGVEAVIDKDLASELLARELEADLFVMPTDADAVYLDWGKPSQRAIRRASPEAIAAFPFPAGSMGPKVEAACRFAKATGKRAAIGALADLGRIIAGEAGTTVTTEEPSIVYA